MVNQKQINLAANGSDTRLIMSELPRSTQDPVVIVSITGSRDQATVTNLMNSFKY